MKRIMVIVVSFCLLSVLISICCATAFADDDSTYYFPVVYQMRGENLDLESATASMIIKYSDTIQHTAANITVRNNTDQDIELVNATLLIADEDEIDRLSRLPKQQYDMEMLRRHYELGQWYKRVEHQRADSIPRIIKPGETDNILFSIEESIYIIRTDLESVACLFQVYAVPKY